MSFGPTGSPRYFLYFFHKILLDRIGKDTASYLDNIMAYTKKGVDHRQAVSEICEIVRKHKLWLSLEKCESSKPKFNSLGLLISCSYIIIDLAEFMSF